MQNLISTSPENLQQRFSNLKSRFEIGLLPYRYRNPVYMIEEGLSGINTWMCNLVVNFQQQTGIN
jgi:hypothetical protein